MLDTPPRDDAPLATSKDSAAVGVATETLVAPRGDTLIGRAVTINRPRAEIFAYWLDLTQLATFMENVERIDLLSAKLAERPQFSMQGENTTKAPDAGAVSRDRSG